ALLMAPFVVRKGALKPLLPHWRAIVVYTVVELCVPWWLLFTAEKKVSSSLSGLLVAAVPIAGAVIARITGTDRIDTRRLAGLGLGIVGAAALVGFDVGRSSLLAASSFLLIITGYALGPWILARHLSELASNSVILASLVIGAVAYAPFAMVQRPRHSVPVNAILSMAGLTVVCTALAFTCFFALIKEVGPMRATVVTYVNPAVAVLLGVTVLGESFGWATAVGFVCVLGGSWLATRPLRVAGVSSAPGGTPVVEEVPVGPVGAGTLPGGALSAEGVVEVRPASGAPG
ncbi:MAG TPA: EamA family transporter, partial [Acidimicrobiales bacterium]|nr:EamA family transporter [Acidimicrobiales bacterium]